MEVSGGRRKERGVEREGGWREGSRGTRTEEKNSSKDNSTSEIRPTSLRFSAVRSRPFSAFDRSRMEEICLC